MTMDMKRFAYLLDLHGADFKRWAAADARAAHELLAAVPAARDLRAQAAALDGMLDAYDVGPLPETVAARAAQAAATTPQGGAINDNHADAAPFFARRGTRTGLALVACTVLALCVGLFVGQGGRMEGVAVPSSAPAQIAAIDAAEDVDIFVFAMAVPFLDSLESELFTAPLERSAAASAEVDIFLDALMPPDSVLDSL